MAEFEPHSSSSPTPTDSAQAGGAAGGPSRSALLIVFLVVFIDLLGFGIVLPLLPRYADAFLGQLPWGGTDAPTGGLILGLLMSSFSAMQFFFAPVWGRISDQVGRRPILLLGLVGSVVFYSLFGFASALPPESAALAVALLFASRLGAGIAGATIATAQAVIADSTPPEKRKHGMALIGAAFGIGFTFGPLLAFAVLHWFPDQQGAVGYLAASLSLLAFLLGLLLLPETRRFDAAPAGRKWFEWHGLSTALRSPSIGPLILVFFLATFGFGGFESTLALLNRDALGLADSDNMLVFAYVGLVLLVTQGFVYRRLAARLSEETFMELGILLMALGLVSLGGITWLAIPTPMVSYGTLLGGMLVSLAVAVVGFAFLTPSVQALISRRSDPARQGEILGANQSASALARILGPFVGLTLYKLEPSHLLPYAFGAVLLLLMLPLLPRIRRG